MITEPLIYADLRDAQRCQEFVAKKQD